MSFILDALRKSEHERQRTAMPGIAQVPFGLARREIPRWALGVIALLVIALLTLAGALWRSTWPDAARDRAASGPARNEVPLSLPAAPSEPRAAFESTDTSAAAPPFATEPASEPRETRDATPVLPPPVPARATASLEPRASAPVTQERAAESARSAARETSADGEPTLPSAAALAAQGVSVPTLHLELHAYADRPADRFVFINGTKYVEGATLAEGPRLVSIAPNGAVLSYLGHRFLLAPQ